MAVPSTGPATTGRPVASAVSRQSSALRAPPPTTCTTSTWWPDSRTVARTARRYASASESRTQRVTATGPSGTGWPVRRAAAAIRAGMSPGGAKAGSSTSTTVRSAGASAAAASSTARSTSSPRSRQLRRLSWSSHSPATLRRYRTVPATPSSLVKFAVRLASDRTGAVSSTPTSDQVPDEMYAAAPDIGTAATAEAVSCDPTVTTCAPGSPVPATASPSTDAGGTTGARSGRASNPDAARSAASTSGLQLPARTSSSPVVDALVRSVTWTPDSQCVSRSGIISSRSAPRCWASAAPAASWYTVLNGCTWVPATA
jgi:hypothetical protein